MRSLLLGTTALVIMASAASAQTPAYVRAIELRPFAGAYVPTGKLRDDFKAGFTFGGQAAYQLTPNFHLLATGSWTRADSKLAPTDVKTNIWSYDVGAELGLVRSFTPALSFHPFFGLGLGARTYDYNEQTFANKTCTAGYGAIGSELQTGPIAFRFEGRDYAVCYKSPVNGKSSTRNDLGFSLGFAYHW
jgi:outer membrane protein with beta-barrel domain